MGELYRITFPNGKAYIGITAKTAEVRFKVHKYEARRGSHGVLYDALRKHGVDAVSLETLAELEDWQELCEAERQAIAAHGTRSPTGYNLTDGGDGAPKGHRFRVGMKHTAEARAKMSRTRVGKYHGTDETRAKLSETMRGNTFGAGVAQSEATRRKRALAIMLAAPSSESGVKGVSRCKKTGLWRAHITVNYKMHDLGRYRDKAAATAARKAAELRVLECAA